MTLYTLLCLLDVVMDVNGLYTQRERIRAFRQLEKQLQALLPEE